MQVQLYSGTIQGGPENIVGGADVLDRAVMLVYEGTFQSMDGEVTVTLANLQGLAANHNRNFDALTLAAGADGVKMKDCPPIQLDHSTSAKDTIGRVYGRLTVAPAIIKGATVMALLGNGRFIGAENVLRAIDGRFTNVSIGADLDTNTLKELSVTPFPAAPHAALLTQGKPMAFDKEKLKKHLKRSTKCSDDEADKKLAGMDDDEMKKMSEEADEEDKKLAAEEDEEKRKLAAEEDEKKKALAAAEGDKDKDEKLSAATAKITKLTALMGQAKTELAQQRTAMRAAEVGNRLAKLRTTGQMTPAEQKTLMAKTDKKASFVSRLAAASDDAQALVFEIMESREPVIIPGQLGSIKAVELSGAGKDMKNARLAEELAEHVSNMPFTSKALAATKDGMTALTGDAGARSIAPATQAVTEPEIETVDDSALEKMKANEKRLSGLLEEITAAL